MKRKLKYLLLIISFFAISTTSVYAEDIAKDDVSRKSYIIGTHMFTEDTVLTTKHIMMAAKTITSNNLDDMVIYYKTARGKWINALTSEETQTPDLFVINYVDTVEIVNEYTVTFNSDGGSAVEPIVVHNLEIPTKPANPTKEGYIFKEWTIFGNTYNFDAALSSDIELKAVWEPIKYQIAFNSTDTGEMENLTCTYNQDCRLTANAYTKNGYVIDGWATTSDGEKVYEDEAVVRNLSTTNNATINLYIIWKARTYTITYNLNGGEASNPLRYTVEINNYQLVNPTKEGYEFTGWTGSNGTEPQKEVIIRNGTTGNLTYTANWTPIEYTITFDKNAENATGTMDSITCTYDTECTLPTNAYTRNGYNFAGWGLQATDTEATYENEATNSKFSTTETLKLYAIWSVKTYTITYNLDDGTATNPTTYTVETANFTLTNPTKEGYEFTGWTGSNGTEPQIDVTINKGHYGDLTYTANWTPLEYTIIFDKNATSVSGTMNNQTCTYGQNCKLTKNTYTKDGYTFVGWALTSEGELAYTDEATNNAFTTDTSLTLYALWAIRMYQITYNLDGGTASNPTTYNIESNTFTLNNPTKEGYTFLGWTGSNGDEKETTVTISKGTTGSLSFTAHWQINTYTIEYDINAGLGEGEMEDTTCTYNVDCTLTKNAYIRENYVFKGWSTTSTGEVEYNDEAVVRNLSTTNNAKVTLYAVWAEEWEFDATTGTIVKYNGLDEDVKIPEKINNINVTKVGTNAFESSQMKSLELGQNITNMAVDSLRKDKNTALRAIYLTNEQYNNVTPTSDKWFAIFGTIGNDEIRVYNYNNQAGTLAYATSGSITFYNTDFRHSITYNLDGGTATNKTFFFAFDEAFTLNKPTKEGYKFNGWTGSNGTEPQKEVTIPSGTNEDLTYTAKWIDNQWSIGLMYGVNGVDINELDYSEVDYSEEPYCGTDANDYCMYNYSDIVTIPVNKVKRDGYTFVGWATEVTNDGPLRITGEVVYRGGEQVTKLISRDRGVLMLYGVWQEND